MAFDDGSHTHYMHFSLNSYCPPSLYYPVCLPIASHFISQAKKVVRCYFNTTLIDRRDSSESSILPCHSSQSLLSCTHCLSLLFFIVLQTTLLTDSSTFNFALEKKCTTLVTSTPIIFRRDSSQPWISAFPCRLLLPLNSPSRFVCHHCITDHLAYRQLDI